MPIPDLSHHNPISSLPTLAANAQTGIILKATEGQHWVDNTFHGRAAHLNSVPLGAYHFAAATRQQTLKLGRYLDWEATRDRNRPIDSLPPDWAAEWISGWLSIIPDGGIYASISVCEQLTGDYPLWVAAWEQPTIPARIGDHPVVLHQHTSQGTFPGVDGRVDLSRKIG